MRLARASAVVALAAVYFGHVFQLPSGVWRTAGVSDWLDPYFINALLEQWRYSLLHLTDPASPPMFFPATGTLGYSVGLILYAPIYILLRLWWHPFPAYTLTLFVTMMMGTLCLYALLRRCCGLSFVEALIVTALFCTSANVINPTVGVWSQVASVFFIPPIVLLGIVSVRRHEGPMRIAGLAATGLLSTLLFIQDVYTGILALLVGGMLAIGAKWFFDWPAAIGGVRVARVAAPVSPLRSIVAWVALALGTAGAVTAWVNRFDSLLFIPIEVRHHRWERPAVVAAAAFVLFGYLRGLRLRVSFPPISRGALAFCAGAFAGALLFAWIYLGAFLEHSSFPAGQLASALLPRDAAAWQRMTAMQFIVPYDSPRPFLFAALVTMLVWLPWLHAPVSTRRACLWFVAVSCVVMLVAVRVGDASLWRLVHAVPGLSAIRDPKRIIYSYELATALAAGLLLARLPRRSPLRLSVVVLALVLIAGYWNTTTLSYGRPVEVFDREVSAPIAIDASCRSFFIKGASERYMSRAGHMWSLYANDAMFIATAHGLPTLNGYSAWGPREWDLTNPQSPEYMRTVNHWIAVNQLKNVCQLDIDARTMVPYESAAPGR